MTDMEDFAEPGPGERAELERQAKLALASGHVSVHDALQGWQRGWIDADRAMELTGCDDVFDMLRACVSSDVEIRLPLSEDEQRLVDGQRLAIEALAIPPREHVDLVADLAQDDPDELRVKFELARTIAIAIEDQGLTYDGVARMTSLLRHDIVRIANRMVQDYSVWRLMRVLATLGHDIAIEVIPGGDGTIYVYEDGDPVDADEVIAEARVIVASKIKP